VDAGGIRVRLPPRYLFTVTPELQLVAAYVRLVPGEIDPDAPFKNYRTLATELTQFLAKNDPRRRCLPTELERRLARYCLLLAMYEGVARSGMAVGPLM
jgi:hypothetical protein